MAKPAMGTWIYDPVRKVYRVRVSLGTDVFGVRQRPWVDMPKAKDDDQAEKLAPVYSKLAREGKIDIRSKGNNDDAIETESPTATTEEHAVKFFEDRKAAGMTSVVADRPRFFKWILRDTDAETGERVPSEMAKKAIRLVTRDDLKRILEKLAIAVRLKHLKKKSAATIWGLVSVMFKEATGGVFQGLAVLDENPAFGLLGPKVRKRDGMIFQFLYPMELIELCASELVPLRWRRCFAIAAFCMLRGGELRVLSWPNIDMENWVMHLVHAWDIRAAGLPLAERTLGIPKGGPRSLPIAEQIRVLFTVMKQERKLAGRWGKDDVLRGVTISGGLVIPNMPSENWLTKQIRHYLRVTKIGIKRPGLLLNDEQHVAMRFHDLRATGITMRAVRGDNAYEIQTDAGHEDFEVTQGYIRTARRIGPKFGEPFPKLPAELMGLKRPGLKRREVAQALGVSLTTVRRMEGTGTLHPLAGRGGHTGSTHARLRVLEGGKGAL